MILRAFLADAVGIGRRVRAWAMLTLSAARPSLALMMNSPQVVSARSFSEQPLATWRTSALVTVAATIVVFLPYFHTAELPHFRLSKLAVVVATFAFSLRFVSRIAYGTMCAFVALMGVIFLHIGHHWGEPGYLFRIAVATVSPLREEGEYLKSYLSAFDLWIAVYFLGSIGLVIAACRVQPPISRSSFLKIATVSLLLGFASLKSSNVEALPFVAIPLEVADGTQRGMQLSARNTLIARMAHPSIECSENYQNVVMVVGESATRDRTSLYGYGSKTTPFLDSIGQYRFDAMSPANQTRYAVSMMLTPATVDDFAVFYKTQSVVSDLKACGYKTYWISNQSARGAEDDLITSIAKEADVSVFLTPNYFGEYAHYDGELLPAFQQLNTDSNERSAVFFHLMGSHVSYPDRYPAAFAAHKERSVGAGYDLTIQYTDQVLQQIFENFSARRLLFLYVSDHGEIVGEHLFGHGFLPAYKGEYRIPFVGWSTQPDRLAALHNATSGSTINMDSFDHVFRYLVGIESNLTGISYARDVVAVSLGNRVPYDSLKEYSEQ